MFILWQKQKTFKFKFFLNFYFRLQCNSGCTQNINTLTFDKTWALYNWTNTTHSVVVTSKHQEKKHTRTYNYTDVIFEPLNATKSKTVDGEITRKRALKVHSDRLTTSENKKCAASARRARANSRRAEKRKQQQKRGQHGIKVFIDYFRKTPRKTADLAEFKLLTLSFVLLQRRREKVRIFAARVKKTNGKVAESVDNLVGKVVKIWSFKAYLQTFSIIRLLQGTRIFQCLTVNKIIWYFSRNIFSL